MPSTLISKTRAAAGGVLLLLLLDEDELHAAIKAATIGNQLYRISFMRFLTWLGKPRQ
jgi:hypothetical protein